MKKKITVLAAALLLTGCGGDNPYTPQAGATAETIFAEACESCHGANGAGKFGVLLRLALEDNSVEEVAAKVRSGGPVMPAFPQIDEATATALATHLKQVTQ